MQLIAVQGLRRHGYGEEADRITVNFLSMILKEFIKHKTIVEKYDVARRTSRVALQFGYPENVEDFGWTGAVFTELYACLPEGKKTRGAEAGWGHTHASSREGHIRP
jgi:alpha,alpha-trehalase